MNQISKSEEDESRSKVEGGDVRLEKITRSILKKIKDADASSSGGVRPDIIRKLIADELKKDKLK